MSGAAERRVAIVGAGSIGVAFAVAFARAGRGVRIWDPVPEALDRARDELPSRLALAGADPAAAGRIELRSSLRDAVAGAELIQECVPERLDVKRESWARIAEAAPDDAVLASSSSAIVPTLQAAELADAVAARLVVAHPGNPPFLLPVVELVAGERTAPDAVDRAVAIYRSVGLRPIRVRREVEGFVFNRLQGALLREAYCLVRDGVATVDDVDEVVRSGLGRRWSFIGPFETVDLNTRGGIASHAEKMGPAYERMGAERGQHDPWTPELVAEVAAARRELLPLDRWDERVRWRDGRLAELSRILDVSESTSRETA